MSDEAAESPEAAEPKATEPQAKSESTAPQAKSESAAADATWKPTADAKKKATTFRWIAVVLWVVAIGLEAYGIWGLLLNTGILVEKTTVDEATGVITTQPEGFPTWAFVVLIVILVLMAALTIVGSQLWKKAQQLDPPSKKNAVSFFFKSQLGAIIPLIAFVPIIILIFLNKNMDKTQKGWAGGVAIVVAVAAVLLGINYKPPSVEQYTAEKMAVIQLLGEDVVYWTAGGEVYHVCGTVSDLANSTVTHGTTAEAIAAGKPRLTLELSSELNSCNRPVPSNIDAIVQAIRDVRDGASTEQILPSPVWPEGVTPPSGGALDQLNDVLETVAG